MNQSLFWLKNTSSTKQTVELFNTSDQSGQAAVPIWNFYNDFSALLDGTWFKFSVTDPVVRLTYTKTDGTSGVVTLTAGALIGCTTAQLESQMNGSFGAFGTWTIDVDGQDATFTCTTTQPYTAISPTKPDFNTPTKGAVELSLSDSTGAVTTSASTIPSNFYTGLKDSPRVEISSYSNFSYNQFIWSVIQRTYNVTNFQVWCADKSQLFEPFLFDRKTAAGRTYQRVATPIMDPYQMQNTVNTEYLDGYLLDGFTSLKYAVDPSANLRLVMDYTYTDISTPLLLRRYGNVYKRLNLFMPSSDFVKRQFPSQPGVLKLLGENDFPLEKW